MSVSNYSVSNISKYPWLDHFTPEKNRLNQRFYLVAKRFLDVLFVSTAMIFAFPIAIVIAVLIKIESPKGSVLYTQHRTGKGGKRFEMFKFRTMVENAEEMKKELMHLNELQWPDFKITNDPRITKIGKFLRKTSLDELPQLLNVLRGEMSLVGPRPTSFSAETYQLWQTERLDVVPGITGLWQIYGRGETEFDERLRMDIAYIERRCLWLDIQILFRTIAAVIQQRGTH